MSVDDRIYELLIDIQKQLGENTRQTSSVNSKIDVFIEKQTATNSKLNGLYMAHTKQLEAMPEENRKMIYGEVDKLKHHIEDEIKPFKEDLRGRQETKKKFQRGGFPFKTTGLKLSD